MKPKLKDINKVIPISTMFGVLGIFFTIFSIWYVLIVIYCQDNSIKTILFVVESVIAFLSMFITLFVMAIKTRKALIEQENILLTNEFDKLMKDCADCANSKMHDGFHYSGLLSFDELIEFEGTLAEDPQPEKCFVLVYTSNLATEKDAEKQVVNNLQKGVQYRVLYFQNSCKPEETKEVQKKYGANNLIDLSQYPDFSNSFDGQLSNTLGFDIMIYQTSSGIMRGFFAVDFIDENRRDGHRDFHDYNCRDMCNFGTKGTAFYKEMSDKRAAELFNGILYFFNKE